MTKRTYCGTKIRLLEKSYGDAFDAVCQACEADWRQSKALAIQKMNEVNALINAIHLTSETAPNLNITKRIEIVTAECAFGLNIFKDLFAGVRDIVGGRSEAIQKTMRNSRKTVFNELNKEAYEVGANAVVGVDLDYVELSSASSMVMLVALL